MLFRISQNIFQCLVTAVGGGLGVRALEVLGARSHAGEQPARSVRRTKAARPHAAALSTGLVVWYYCKYLEKTYIISGFVKTGGSKSVKNWTQTNHGGSFELVKSQGFCGVHWDLQSGGSVML